MNVSLPLHRWFARQLLKRNLPAARRVGGAALILMLASSSAWAQRPAGDRYYPYDHTVAPGVAGEWSAYSTNPRGGCFQNVRVEIPKGGQVTFYGRPQDAPVTLPAPAQGDLLVGAVYRLRISGMPDYPGVELFPSIELVDRLHAPPGRAVEFPVPITFSDAEIEAALDGRLITKIVYLEQPDKAYPDVISEPAPSRLLDPTENAFAVADHSGRPMAVVRLGGRLLDPQDSDFFGAGAPVRFAARQRNAATAVAGRSRKAATVRPVAATAREPELRERATRQETTHSTQSLRGR